MNRCMRDPHVQWCERRTLSELSGRAVYSISGRCIFIMEENLTEYDKYIKEKVSLVLPTLKGVKYGFAITILEESIKAIKEEINNKEI